MTRLLRTQDGRITDKTDRDSRGQRSGDTENAPDRDFYETEKGAAGVLAIASKMTRLTKVPVVNFCPDRKKDRTGSLRRLPAAVTAENAPVRDFYETEKGAAGVLAIASKMTRLTKVPVVNFCPDRKKDRTGSLRRLPAAVTAENAPIRDFCETEKGAAGVLAIASKMIFPGKRW